jgi:hypothetical protein
MESFAFTEGSVTLNAAQATIVRSDPRQNQRILASAGSGKTTTLTARIAWLLTNAGARPENIILLTFTHNAATVMKERLEALVGPTPLLCGTFHALSQQLLRRVNPESLEEVYHVDELPLKALDYLISPEGQEWVRTTIRWIFIDEYQDINDTQHAFIKALHIASSVTIVGDDAQNIYTWRGSSVDYILNFHQKFDDVIDYQLSTNYRSKEPIIAVANSVMRRIPTLPHKQMMTAPLSLLLEDAEDGRPEVLFYSRISEECDAIVTRAIQHSQAGASVVILSKFNSVLYMFEATLLKLNARVRFVDGGEPCPNTIYLSTFHGSKGLEWDHVFLVRMNDEVFPQLKDEDSVDQERRLFYVAVTRARKTLTLSYSRNERSLSRFIREIHRPLLQWRTLPRYELSDMEGAMAHRTVEDWVATLTGEDYRTIKALHLLPPLPTFPTAEDIPIHQARVTPPWWVERGMVREFFDFLQAAWHREVGLLRPESGGLWDRQAQDVTWTVKIAAEDAALFEKERDLFEHLVHQFFSETEPGTAPPQIYYTEILAAIQVHTKGRSFEQPTLIRIIQIIHKMRTMLYNLRFANVRLSDLRFAPIRHTPPQEFRCSLIEAWRTYTSRTTDIPLLEIYKIGLCRSLSTGRSGVVAALPGVREFARVLPFLAELRTKIRTLVAPAKYVLSRCTVTIAEGSDGSDVTATADLLIDETAWFFIAGEAASELQRLDRLIIILLTVHGLRKAGYTVTGAKLYQPLTGLSVLWSLPLPSSSTSSSGTDLLCGYVQARASYVSS